MILWRAGIGCEILYKKKPNIKDQLGYGSKIGAKLAVILAPDEFKDGNCKIKNLSTTNEIVVPINNIVDEVQKLLH